MIAVDYRAGSHELVEPLEALGLEVAETDLPFGDLAFEGRGEGGKPVSVGIEFKKLEELVGAMRSERLQGHQLPGMRGAEKGQRPLYDFAWLLIEGELVYDKRGRLQKRVGRREFKPMAGGMGVAELFKRLFAIHIGWGVPWILVHSRRDTLKVIEMLYRAWTDKDQDEHTSHMGIYQPPSIIPISDFRQAVSSPLFPGISLRKSLAVERAFKGSLRKAVNASTKTWAAIEVVDKHGHTKRLGTKIAEKIQEKIK
jgi:ERCC4-type nuclease